MENDVIANVKKIVVVRGLVLGDLIFSLPAFDALHKTYPDAEIVYVGRKWHAEFIPGRIPGITQVCALRPTQVTYEDLGFMIAPEEAETFFTSMRAEQFDLGFQMQGGGKNSNPFVRRMEPRVAIGPREEGAIALDRWIPYEYHQSEFIRQLDIVRLAGAKPTDIYPQLQVLEKDREAAAPFLKAIRRPFVVMHSGARDIRRCWPPQKYARLADTLKRKLGLEVVLTGLNEVDDDTAHIIEQSMEETPVNLVGKLSLSGLVGLLANAQLMISNDTGPMHLALALGVKTVGLYWVEYVIKSMPLRRDIFHPLIDWNRHCPLCGIYMDHFEVVSCDPRPCMHEVTFLDHIQPEEVLYAAQDVLGRAGVARF